MTATLEIVPSVLDRIRRTLVGLKMPRALEVLDQTMRQLERGEASALEVIDTLFAEELTLRENRRVKMALRMAKLSTIKTLAGRELGHAKRHLDASVLAQCQFLREQGIDHFERTGFAALELAHGLIKNFQSSRHLETDQGSADAVKDGRDDL